MAAFNLADYETVEDRLKRFWAENPDGTIVTEIVANPTNGGEWVVRAEIYANKESHLPMSTGLASEIPGKGMANATSALENCETSAIGRGLANWKYSGNKRASREEMAKVARGARPTNNAKQLELMDLVAAATTKEELRVIYADAKKLGLKAVEDAVTLKADKLTE
jgi:hypothetical protein